MHTKTHRHFVAFPIAVFLMIVITGFDTVLSVSSADLAGASVVRFTAEKTPVDFQSGWMLSGTLEPNSAVRADKSGEHPELIRGQALIRSSDFTELTVGSVRVHALAASYVAIRESSSVTVAALSSFVLVTTDTETVIVAPGMQFTVNAAGKVQTALLPPEWYNEKLQAAKMLRESTVPEISANSSRLAQQAQLARLLLDGRITQETFSVLEFATQQLGTDGVVERLLLLRLLQEGFRTDADVSALISTKIAEDKFLSSALVPVLPLSIAVLRKPVAEAHIQLWEKSALSLGLTDSAAALSLLHRYAQLPEQLTRTGYPQQSLLWQKALSYVGTTLRTTLSGQAVQDLDADLAVINRSGVSAEPEVKKKASVYVPVTHWSETELIEIVRSTIIAQGVLVAVTTQLAPDTPTQTVRVTGVYKAEQGSDIQYEFTFDVARNVVRDIVRNGKQLPNAVTVEQFFR